MRFAALVLSLALAAPSACSSASAPTSEADVDLTFGIQRPASEPAFLVQSGTQGIIIRGVYEALSSGYTAEASARLTGRTLELHVLGKQPSASYPVISPTGYEAIVRGIAVGPLHVRVVHEWRGVSRSPVVVIDEYIAMD